MADQEKKQSALSKDGTQDPSKSLNKSKDVLQSMLLENEKSPVSRTGNQSNLSKGKEPGTSAGANDEECTRKCGCDPEEPPKVEECTKKCGCPPDEPVSEPCPEPPASQITNESGIKEKPKPKKYRPPSKPKPPPEPIKDEHEPFRQAKLGRQYLEHLMCSDELKKPDCLEERYCVDGTVNDWIDVKSNYMRHAEPMKTIHQSSYTVNTINPPDVDTMIYGKIRNWGHGPSFLYHYHGMSPSAPEPISTYQATFNDYESEKSHLRPLHCKKRNYVDDLLLNYDCPACDVRKFSNCPKCEMRKLNARSGPHHWENEEYIFAQNGPVHPLYQPN